MATRIARPPFRRKTGLRISRVPDIIVVPTLSQPVVIDIVVPAGDPIATDRVVMVSNTSASTVQIKVKGGMGATALAAGLTGQYLIRDSSATTVPTKLFVEETEA